MKYVPTHIMVKKISTLTSINLFILRNYIFFFRFSDLSQSKLQYIIIYTLLLLHNGRTSASGKQYTKGCFIKVFDVTCTLVIRVLITNCKLQKVLNNSFYHTIYAQKQAFGHIKTCKPYKYSKTWWFKSKKRENILWLKILLLLLLPDKEKR